MFRLQRSTQWSHLLRQTFHAAPGALTVRCTLPFAFGAHLHARQKDLLMMVERRALSSCLLACASCLLSLLAACGDEGSCAALCQPKASFKYAEPQPGRNYAVSFAPGGPTLTCELAATGEADCQPNVGGFHLEFGPSGLSSFSWPEPPAGELRVSVTIDDELVTDQRFKYEGTGKGDACTGDCYEDPMFELD
jgi:hypothetical protein